MAPIMYRGMSQFPVGELGKEPPAPCSSFTGCHGTCVCDGTFLYIYLFLTKYFDFGVRISVQIRGHLK